MSKLRVEDASRETDEEEEEEDEDDDECFDYDYYNSGDCDTELYDADARNKDTEYFEFECLPIEEVERLLNECVESVCSATGICPSLAKVLLYVNSWNVETIKEKHRRDPNKFLTDSRVKAPRSVYTGADPLGLTTVINLKRLPPYLQCNICLQSYPSEKCSGLSCGHLFCKDCWSAHLEIQVSQGLTVGIECMAQACHIIVPEDFALGLLTKMPLREKYQQFAFSDYVKSHPELRYCPGVNCNIIIRAKENKSKRVICKHCKSSFCFKCGGNYHAPTGCETIKRWLTKCADDSETANYISAHTKDCPKCHICIEKNGGCNHMQCYSCKHDFCWMCLGDWKSHGSEYYECSRYKENPNIATESAHAQAREALKKYLFYYERWENHARSLRLEEQTLERIKERIQEKVMSNKGTWIDWQYLVDAAALLAKCRYTLQYTYPYAYYLESGPRKQLFEYQQAQLEAEIENLSWKVERAETTDRGDLENQMDIAEKRRATLLKDFLT